MMDVDKKIKYSKKNLNPFFKCIPMSLNPLLSPGEKIIQNNIVFFHLRIVNILVNPDNLTPEEAETGKIYII